MSALFGKCYANGRSIGQFRKRSTETDDAHDLQRLVVFIYFTETEQFTLIALAGLKGKEGPKFDRRIVVFLARDVLKECDVLNENFSILSGIFMSLNVYFKNIHTLGNRFYKLGAESCVLKLNIIISCKTALGFAPLI